MNDRTFERFVAEIRESLEQHAQRKGYHNGGVNEPNELQDEGIEWGDEPAHSIGEARYKLREYLHEPREVLPVKVMAWMFLVWRATPAFRRAKGLPPEQPNPVPIPAASRCIR